MREGRLKRAGLVATNSMRGGANRRVLDAIVKDGAIFDAWDDEPWIIKAPPSVSRLFASVLIKKSSRGSMENQFRASART